MDRFGKDDSSNKRADDMKCALSGPTLYILCGLPFAGKTTLARALFKHCGFVHLDLDSTARAKGLFPEEGVDDEQWSQIFREAYECTAALLVSGKSVVFDAMNTD
jgi:predicted kinase